MNGLICFVLLLSLTTIVHSLEGNFICPRKGTRPVNGKVLSSHSVKTAPDCAWLCLDDPNCTSFLVHNPRSSTMGCELRDQSGVDHIQLVEDPNIDHYSRRECDSGPCVNGGTCTDLVDGHTCACKAGFKGRHCASMSGSDCADIKKLVPASVSGVYTLLVDANTELKVDCDMDTDGGGWLVFQKRLNGNTDFFRPWEDYAAGFGDLLEEFWLGNRKLHLLTSRKSYTLRVYMADFEGGNRYAKYSSFAIGPESDGFRLTAAGYSGDAGDSLAIHNGQQFSTRDRDNDRSSNHCAQRFNGAWWYNHCHQSNLNGLYLFGPTTLNAQGVTWRDWKGQGYSLKTTIMMIRPVDN